MEFDPLLADPTRLKILALLASCDWADFSFVCDAAGLSKSALSKQITKLEAHEYVQVHKGYAGKFPRTSLRLTDTGRTAIDDHLAALQQIVIQSRQHRPPQ
ncbi:winged helix-turn-helix domain-containing protein [Streptomonospora litoralis]|uniref:Helix-turn-helix domain protein n=1 Tax=Streptomonospora litoralis TaxID=2498135 RepID=A0A4P6PVJ8_9ACTN|nr:transcriptional regulator [Streptomonospora litoralis]QBI52075.1 Helix-turn-helix domain protein [Streptomonospora litoralis]